MSIESQLSREEEYLDNALNRGEIDQQQYNDELRDLHQSFYDAQYEQEREAFEDAVRGL